MKRKIVNFEKPIIKYMVGDSCNVFLLMHGSHDHYVGEFGLLIGARLLRINVTKLAKNCLL